MSGLDQNSKQINLVLRKCDQWKTVEINDEMVDVPVEWNVVALKGNVNFKKGKGLSKKEICIDGKHECIHYGELFGADSEINTVSNRTNHEKEKMVLSKENDVLMPTSDVTPRGLATASCIKKNDVILGGDILVISPNDEIFGSYLSRQIRFEKNQILNLVTGSTVYHIYAKDMEKFLLKKPPLKQQSLIAHLLTQQEDLLSSIETTIALEKKRFQYLSDELLSGRLRLRERVGGQDGEVEIYKNIDWKSVEVNGEMVDVPVEWGIEKFGKIFSCLDNLRKPLNSTERSKMKGVYPYWGANSIVDHVNQYLVEEECLLLGEDAAPFFDKTKKVAFYSNQKIWPNNHIHVLKVRDDHNIHFFEKKLNIFDYSLILNVKNRPKLTQGLMSSMMFSCPSKKEQSLIARLLTQQEDLIAKHEERLTLEKKRLQWLMDNLLTGKYLVEQKDAL